MMRRSAPAASPQEDETALDPHMTAKVLRRAAEIVEARGWCQGAFMKLDGRVCAAEAVILADQEVYGDFRFERMHPVGQFAAQVAGHYALMLWNDCVARTDAEVIDLFRRAAESAEGAASEASAPR